MLWMKTETRSPASPSSRKLRASPRLSRLLNPRAASSPLGLSLSRPHAISFPILPGEDSVQRRRQPSRRGLIFAHPRTLRVRLRSRKRRPSPEAQTFSIRWRRMSPRECGQRRSMPRKGSRAFVLSSGRVILRLRRWTGQQSGAPSTWGMDERRKFSGRCKYMRRWGGAGSKRKIFAKKYCFFIRSCRCVFPATVFILYHVLKVRGGCLFVTSSSETANARRAMRPARAPTPKADH